MSHSPNAGGSKQGPKVTKQSSKKGPIIGSHPAGKNGGPTKPWSFGQGSNKGMNFGRNVKKS